MFLLVYSLGSWAWKTGKGAGVETEAALAEATGWLRMHETTRLTKSLTKSYLCTAIHFCKEFGESFWHQSYCPLCSFVPQLWHTWGCQNSRLLSCTGQGQCCMVLYGPSLPVQLHSLIPDAKRTCHSYTGKVYRAAHNHGLLQVMTQETPERTKVKSNNS